MTKYPVNVNLEADSCKILSVYPDLVFPITQILNPVQHSFQELLHGKDFSSFALENDVKLQVAHLLCLLKGVIVGTQVNRASDLFNFCLPMLRDSVSLLRIYHNYADIVEQSWRCFVEVAMHQLCFLTQVHNDNCFEFGGIIMKIGVAFRIYDFTTTYYKFIKIVCTCLWFLRIFFINLILPQSFLERKELATKERKK